MLRILAILTLLLSVALAGSGIWLLFQPPLTPFLLPNATDIQVLRTGVWEWQIAYDAPGPPYAWYVMLAHSIEAHQWKDSTLWRPDGSTMFDPVTALRFERGYAGVLWDEVELVPDHRDPQRATIRLRRRIRIPWWQEWLPAGHQDAAIGGMGLRAGPKAMSRYSAPTSIVRVQSWP